MTHTTAPTTATATSSSREPHGDPQFLIEKITRNKIYHSAYWNTYCYGLNEETIIDECIKLQYIRTTYASERRPTEFLCLLLKLLQLKPSTDIMVEYLYNDDY